MGGNLRVTAGDRRSGCEAVRNAYWKSGNSRRRGGRLCVGKESRAEDDSEGLGVEQHCVFLMFFLGGYEGWASFSWVRVDMSSTAH